MNNNKTSTAKFEEFFATEYKEEVFNILEEYPFKKDLKIDYQKLEICDPELADLLIERPEEVIETAQIAIKNIDPLVKDANINVKFDNVTNIIPFNKLSSDYVGEFVVIEGYISNIEDPSPILKTGVFECRACMRLCEVEQTSGNHIVEPSLCSECGGRSFRLLTGESTYIDNQVIQITDKNTSRNLNVILKDTNCSYDAYNMYDSLQITGILKAYKKGNKFIYYFETNNVVKLPNSIIPEDEISERDRNSPEYNQWVKEVINRDKICQCCGGEKHLVAHHVFGYKNHEDLRINPDNGVALCKWCHGKYHSYHGISSANPQTLIKFIRRFGRF